MSAIYYAILTTVGQAKLANALALGIPLPITKMGVGDGNGQPVTPNPAMTALVNERRRANINTLFQDPLNQSQIVAEQVIPEDVGDWWVREIGLYDNTGALIAVANCPDTYKPLLTSGAGRTQVIRMVLIVSDTAAVELKIDPSVVLATRKYVDDVMAAHKLSREHPDASESEKGFVQLATAAQAAPATEAEASSAVVASIARVFGVLRSAIANATETLRGTLRIATDSELLNGTSDTIAVTPKKIKQGMLFAGAGSTLGFRLPAWLGSWTFNIGNNAPITNGAVTITFPIGFSDTNYTVFFGARQSQDPTVAQSHVIDDPSRTAGGFRVRQFSIVSGSVTNGSSGFFWLAIGKSS